MIQNRFSNSNFVARKEGSVVAAVSRAKLRTHYKMLTMHESRISSVNAKKRPYANASSMSRVAESNSQQLNAPYQLLGEKLI
jgi:hypothetical protein